MAGLLPGHCWDATHPRTVESLPVLITHAAPPGIHCCRVQRGLSVEGGDFGFYRRGLAADKRYSLGRSDHHAIQRV